MSEIYTRGIRAEIILTKGHDSNYGLSSRTQTVTIVGPGIPETTPVNAGAPAVILTTVKTNGEKSTFFLPVGSEAADELEPSGAFIYTDDLLVHSIIGTAAPVPLHDLDREYQAPDSWGELFNTITDFDLDTISFEWELEETQSYSCSINLDTADLQKWIAESHEGEFTAESLRDYINARELEHHESHPVIKESDWVDLTVDYGQSDILSGLTSN